MDAPQSTVPEIDVTELARLQAAGVTLIDVREPDEYDGGHVPGAELIPLGTVPERLDEAQAKEGTVYVICAMGGRSHKAAEFFRTNGIDAVNVAGGTKAWIEADRPTNTGMEP
ncbi:MAG TPA: rhodanese-like domain-containing protein [Acidimicrobiales bacterium]|nr:rhodanese-like domain-containing protein [Acidimicrobiales bacterium]